MKIIFLIRVFRWCKSVEPWTCLRRSLSCPNFDHHLFSASISEFKYSINQASRLSQFKRAPFLEDDLPDLHTSLFQSFHADCRATVRKARNSITPRSSFRLTSDRKLSQSILLSFHLYSGFISESNLHLWKLNLILDLPNAITIARFIGISHTNICWKEEKDIYVFHIQCFWSFHFESWSKIWNSQFLPELVIAKFQQHSSNSIKHISWTIDRMKAREYPLERGWITLYLFCSSLSLNPIPTVPILYFLTATCSQVRLNVSIRMVISNPCR
jgi:hypothetical protein